MKYLKVSADTEVGGLAGAIAGSLRRGEDAEVVSVGAGALNQAVKAVVIAKEFLAKEGKDIAMEPRFSEVCIDNKEKTAINLHIFEILLEEAA
ncbi:MAG: stage V sporulation protein S [Clostridia bacterium]|nr:stage V sporulation protein S [Clostridia bacterium]MCR5694270.1 stage V sporulation protein S [Clostridia bacterium]